MSVVIAARDATAGLPGTLASIAGQDYPRILEVVVAAADPETAEVARRHGAAVVDNPAATTPAGLNRAIEVTSGEVIVRCDAHAVLPPGYVSTAVETLARSGADNVGGMQQPVGETFWERAIAAAMASPVGAGDARYRIGGEEGPVETVYLGVFPRHTLERLGGFDESFHRNQDYELNHRIIAGGGVVWFDPALRVGYRPRGSLAALAGQYYQYGRAKRQFARAHPGSLRLRQMAPPLLVVGLVAAVAVSPFWPWALLAPAGYLAGLVLAGMATAPQAGAPALAVPLALATMHLSWGLGFLTGRRGRRRGG